MTAPAKFLLCLLLHLATGRPSKKCLNRAEHSWVDEGSAGGGLSPALAPGDLAQDREGCLVGCCLAHRPGQFSFTIDSLKVGVNPDQDSCCQKTCVCAVLQA